MMLAVLVMAALVGIGLYGLFGLQRQERERLAAQAEHDESA